MGAEVKTKTNRMANLELLRIVSMLMVIMLHLFTQGNVLQSLTGGVNYYFVWIMEALCYTSVNCYVLISGFFMWKTGFKWRRFFSLYAQILFYTIVLTLVTFIVAPSCFEGVSVTKFLPVLSGNNWYVSTYFGLFFLTPILNAAIRNISQNTHKCVIGILFVLFSLAPSILYRFDPFRVNAGYSVLWFIFVYLVASYIGKYEIKIRRIFVIMMCLALVFVPLTKFLMDMYHLVSGNYDLSGTFLYTYNSAPVIIASVGFFAIFLSLRIRDGAFGKIIIKVARTTFGIFYIHTFFIYRDVIWEKIGSTSFVDSPLFIPYCFGIVIAIFIVCAVIDFLRDLLFRLIRLDKLIERIGDAIDKKTGVE